MENKGKEEKPIVIFSFTEEGCRLNRKLNALLAKAGYECVSYTTERFAAGFGMNPMDQDLKQWIGVRWGSCSFLFIGAAGIAIRYIAPWVADKYRDSAVLSMEEKGGFVIPLLSGHVGGAVRLAMLIAEQTGAVPVVTTATDVQNKFAVDVFAKENHLHIGSRRLAKEISAAVLEGKKIGFYSAYPVEGRMPEELCVCRCLEELGRLPLGIAVADAGTEIKEGKNILFLPPRNLVAGVGCRRGTPGARLKEKLEVLLKELGVSLCQIQALASIDLKRDEAGLLELAQECRVPFATYSADELQEIEAVSSHSEFVEKITGVDNVCERAARKYAPEGVMIQPKIKLNGITYAVVRENTMIRF